MDPPPPPPQSSSEPTETPPPQPPQQQPPPSQQPQQPPSQQQEALQPASSSNPNPNPNPNAPQMNRVWPPQTSPFSHFPSQFQPPPSSSSSPSLTPSPSQPPPRAAAAASSSSSSTGGGPLAIGVPSSHPPSFVPPTYSSLPRTPDPTPAPGRPPMHGVPNMVMIGSQIRPGGPPSSVLNQQRPVQAASNNMPSVSQNFQGHGMIRASSITSPNSTAPSTSQNQQQQSIHQPWLSSVPQHGRPPLPSQPLRPHVNSQTLQQRSHIPQQSPQPAPGTSQPQQLSFQQQQPPSATSNQSQQNHAQQLVSSRVSHPSANQQQITRVAQGVGNPKGPSPAMVQPNPTVPVGMTGGVDVVENCNRILSKRSIQELVNQIDPSERLDPEVEDVLVDIAEDFIDSVTTFGCSLAKHRKSNILEAKDILLHLERNWDMTLPGFGGDEIRTFKKPVANEAHKERLAVVRKSLAATEVKSSAGPATGNVKGPLSKATPNIVGS